MASSSKKAKAEKVPSSFERGARDELDDIKAKIKLIIDYILAGDEVPKPDKMEMARKLKGENFSDGH